MRLISLFCFIKLHSLLFSKMRHCICRMLSDINTMLFKILRLLQILSLVSVYSPKKNGGVNFFNSSKQCWAASAFSQMTRQASSPQRVAIASGKFKASMIEPNDWASPGRVLVGLGSELGASRREHLPCRFQDVFPILRWNQYWERSRNYLPHVPLRDSYF